MRELIVILMADGDENRVGALPALRFGELCVRQAIDLPDFIL